MLRMRMLHCFWMFIVGWRILVPVCILAVPTKCCQHMHCLCSDCCDLFTSDSHAWYRRHCQFFFVLIIAIRFQTREHGWQTRCNFWLCMHFFSLELFYLLWTSFLLVAVKPKHRLHLIWSRNTDFTCLKMYLLITTYACQCATPSNFSSSFKFFLLACRIVAMMKHVWSLISDQCYSLDLRWLIINCIAGLS